MRHFAPRRLALLVLSGLALILVAPARPMLGQKAEPKKAAKEKLALADARRLLLKGNYDEARAEYERQAKADATLAPFAAVGIAATHRMSGEYDKALTVLNDAVKATANNADLLAARADLLADLGRWDDADKDADAALKLKDNQLLARWTKARLLRDRGQIPEADAALRWVVRHYTARSNADDDITDPEELLCVALCGAENARWNNLSRQFSFILNEVLKDAIKADKDYWPAEFMAGVLLLEKYNRPDALDAFDKVLTVNPKAADAHVGKAMAALVTFNVEDADKHAAEALKHNASHVAALRVKAEVRTIGGEYRQAERLLRDALAVNPRDPATLGRLAAVLYLLNDTATFDKVVKEAEGYDAKPGLFYHELASSLEDRKRYVPAEGYYKKAADLRPNLSAPRTGLGMLYLRLGNEAEGRKLLDDAFKKDPFNVRVSNSRKVMAHLDAYTTVETAHYVLRFDAKTDQVLADILAEYLEEVHAELKGQFDYEPKDKTLIEVFNSHEMFSGRTVGLPDLHTIGACTGKVVAMASPKAKGLAKPFNYGRVIRHELTHIFNLAQTEFQVPHWMTEGLAVQNEKMNRPPMWSQILRDQAAANDLHNLDTIMMGFVKPREPYWTLAYCQAQLYVDYLVKAHGQAAVGKVMEQFRQGKDTAAALKAACGVEKAAFEKGYREYVNGVIAALGGKAKTGEKPLKPDELEAAVEKNPDDLDLKARLAELHERRGKAGDAKKLADEVLDKKANHPTASVVRSKLLARAGDDIAAGPGAGRRPRRQPGRPPADRRRRPRAHRRQADGRGGEAAGAGPQDRAGGRRLARPAGPHLHPDERRGQAGGGAEGEDGRRPGRPGRPAEAGQTAAGRAGERRRRGGSPRRPVHRRHQRRRPRAPAGRAEGAGQAGRTRQVGEAVREVVAGDLASRDREGGAFWGGRCSRRAANHTRGSAGASPSQIRKEAAPSRSRLAEHRTSRVSVA